MQSIRSRFRSRAYSLVEFMIVVALLAALSAIAVANFTDAEIISMTSRAKSDLRTMASAIESYYVDHGSYPPNSNGTLGNGWGATDTYVQYFTIPLSTPIAYLSQGLMPDPFGNLEPDYDTIEGFSTYYYASLQDDELVPAFVYGNSPYYAFSGQCSQISEESTSIYSHKWIVWSSGPDRLHEVQRLRTQFGGLADSGGEAFCMWGANLTCEDAGGPSFYDPTNGLISRGDIFRTHMAEDPKPEDFAIDEARPCRP